ncbi:MAG TPA: sulfatase [Candidatus Latescibacteria bacterium]|nr:sulfatase [Candidatus Latescibacterota bacterium]
MNVLFILADQFRADCLGHLGNDTIKTPNLDRLAREGVSFTHGFNQAAPCGPSRMCIFTSRYMCSARAINNMTPLRDAHESLPQHLRDAGHNPGLIGYNDYTPDPEILAPEDERRHHLGYDNCLPGFERVYYHEYDSEEYFAWLGEQKYPDELLSHAGIHQPDVPAEGPGPHLPQHFPAKYRAEHSECAYVTDRAIDYVQQRGATQEAGWVLSLNYIKPHPPNICCAPYHDMYDPATMPPAARSTAEQSPTHPFLRALAPDQLQEDLHLREYRACYYGMITEVDDNLGRLFQALESSGQWEDTLIIFSADHAEHLGDHYLTGKGMFYDGGMRIPWIVRDPTAAADTTRGQIRREFVQAIDSAPTIMDWLGLEIPDRFQGRSVLPLIRDGGDYEARREIHYEFDYRQGAMARGAEDPDEHLLWVVRDHEHKLVQFADPEMPPILFDLQADPEELENVAQKPAYQAKLLDLSQRLLRWRMRHEDQRAEHWAQNYR